MSCLESLTFESGSKLREIQSSAFGHCQSLKSLFLPASLSVIDGSTFLESSIEEISVDAGNPNYFVSGQFLIGVEGMTLIRYFGHRERLAIDCLCDLGLRQIGPDAFSYCSILKSILIPASIEILGDNCFNNCFCLSQIIFESASKVLHVGTEAFSFCSSLASICIPATLENISEQCFYDCPSLVEVSFEPDSKLTRIEEKAFAGCHSLRSFVIPSQLEIMARDVFRDCTSLCELIFEIPSRLKQLELAPSEFGCLSIPDSVEVVCAPIGKRQGQNRLLQFGPGSCLMKIALISLCDFYGRITPREADSFVHLSENVLRRFRCKFEDL
jgi:hypothetical protein